MALATLQVLNSHTWLEATVLDSAAIAHFHHHRNSIGQQRSIQLGFVGHPANTDMAQPPLR